ncbi:cobyric acid synthase [Catenovulum maritimum]|uniref:Cobyric acid synthase n=1 Tax=Catenovulum maritimum TaxID=1513271 RepID=A0A0J8GX93_9ALTE|nr:cobyric acid synthase [Catenovulum maritimum]KMT65343.1 cobyric acid synthase [Catenovulum maritimum]
MNKTLMVQGTSSDAGKSLLVAGICRVLARKGFKIAPFKPQNMALNSAVTQDGGEIGRAQAIQALAAGVKTQVDFNPILLKPSSDTGAQVIIHGKAVSDMQATKYHDYKKVAMNAVIESFERLNDSFDCIIVEGAGSPAEINLREGDIANMGFAEKVDCPVVLVADIDRGGVFAQIVGTLELLSESERNRIVGFVINKFRGDIKLLESGLTWLENKTNKPVLGVLPFIKGLEIAAEDAIETQQVITDEKVTIVIPVFPRISNHTDFDSLRLHPQINLIYANPNKALPSADLIILPGSKNVRADLEHLRKMQWDKQIDKHLRYGGKLFAICGGYQMLGHLIKDPNGYEYTPGQSHGLGYLPIETELKQDKVLINTEYRLNLAGRSTQVKGYEIHCGVSQITDESLVKQTLLDNANGLNKSDGFVSLDNQVAGCYLHGIFDNPEAVNILANWLNADLCKTEDYVKQQLSALDKLADACEAHIDFNPIYKHLNIK